MASIKLLNPNFKMLVKGKLVDQSTLDSLLKVGAGELQSIKDFDALDFIDIPFEKMFEYARRTLGNALYECSHPKPKTNPAEVQALLGEAMVMGWMCRSLENALYDWNLHGDQTLRALHHRYEEFERSDRIRGRPSRHARGDLMKNLGERMWEDFRHLRELEQRVRSSLDNPIAQDYDYDCFRPEAVVDACFDAAIMLEAQYDDTL